MNWGAKVPAGVVLRVELERKRTRSLWACNGLLSCVSDLLRRWLILVSDSAASGDEKRPDVGRALVGGPGEGESEFRAKGLLREFLANGLPFGAGALMVEASGGGDGGPVRLCYSADARPDANIMRDGMHSLENRRMLREEATRAQNHKYVQDASPGAGEKCG